MIRPLLAALLALSPAAGLAGEAPAPKPEPKAEAPKEQPKAETPTPAPLASGTYARIKTAKGDILVRLLPEGAPETVKNFVELAKGERPFKDAEGRWTIRPFYKGLTFYRVEKDRLILGGSPTGKPAGGPGYELEREPADKLKLDAPGRVAMADVGPETNGSQFAILLEPMPNRDTDFIIFGDVVRGLDVAKAISEAPAKAEGDIHVAEQPVAIESVTIEEVKAAEPAKAGEEAKKD